MPRRDIREYIRSRWDARFLVNNIMGLLSKQQDPSGDVVLAIITASIRSYSKAYSGRMDRTQEEGTYEALKDYAHERVIHKGRDAESMEEFLSMVRWAESEVFGFISVTECDTKPNASFPMDCLGEEELAIVRGEAWDRFRAKLYCSDGVPEVGMLVFEDEAAKPKKTRPLAKKRIVINVDNSDENSDWIKSVRDSAQREKTDNGRKDTV